MVAREYLVEPVRSRKVCQVPRAPGGGAQLTITVRHTHEPTSIWNLCQNHNPVSRPLPRGVLASGIPGLWARDQSASSGLILLWGG